MADFDLAVIGGGIVGLSTAMQMTERFPGVSVAVLEKEPALARHQTGRNSGVIHAGVYYQPGSLKAQFCREGVEATIQFCRERDIAYEQCGKLLVATEPAELPRMEALYERARANGIDVERWPGSSSRPPGSLTTHRLPKRWPASSPSAAGRFSPPAR
jgi:(S)-2-hydroxyglutarate dehydrogenase